MKVQVCKRYGYMQADNEKGDVRPCVWTTIPSCGNLLKDSVHTIFSGETMSKLHQSMIDGSYRYCRKEACRFLANETPLDEYGMWIDTDDLLQWPTELSLSFEQHCNYRCTVCGSKLNHGKQENPQNMDIIRDRLMEALPHARIVGGNGTAELFCSPRILSMLSQWEPEDPEHAVVELETNGSLFTEANWNKISNIGKYHFILHITVMSFEDTTYRYLSGTDMPVENVIENLRLAKRLREQGVINHLELATVVQEANFRTLPEFTRRCIEEFGADLVRLRPFFPNFCQPKHINWFWDVRNPEHPYFSEYQKVMENPIFKHPKVEIWTGNILSSIGTFEQYTGLVPKEQCAPASKCTPAAVSPAELSDVQKRLEDIQNSVSFKVGRGITFLPRKLRDLVKK